MEWEKIGSKEDKVKLIWKGDSEKGVVWVKMKVKGEGRWFVFKGELKFSGIEEEEKENV